jgi:hypothetical protein
MYRNVRCENYDTFASILVDANRHINHSTQENCQGREVSGAHGSEIGHFEFVDDVLAGDIPYQANSRKSLYQKGIFDGEFLLKDDLDDFLIHVNILAFIRDKFIASKVNTGDKRPVWCKMFINIMTGNCFPLKLQK